MLPARRHEPLYPDCLIQTHRARVSPHDALAQNATRQRFKLFVFERGKVTRDYLRLLADGLQRDTPRLAFPPQLFAKVPHVRNPSWGDLPLQDKAEDRPASKKNRTTHYFFASRKS